jgi:urea transport system permease protein
MGGVWARVKTAIAAFAIVALPGLVAPPAARADASSFETAVQSLSTASEDSLAKAVETLGATGDPRAIAVLQALDSGDLLTSDGHVFVKGADGAPHDVITGAVGTGSLRSPEVDNNIRRVLGPVLAHLQLASPDPKVRLAAVDILANHGSDEDVAVLRTTLATDKDPSVKRAIVSALAEQDLASTDADRRLAAVAAIGATGTMRFRDKLAAMSVRGADGSYPEPDARVRAAAASTVSALDRKQWMIDGAANILYGMSTGSILLLSALGLAITFGLMRVINMAHGEMLMLGAYATFVTQTFFHQHMPQYEGYYLVAAIPVALVFCMAVGAVLERTVVRFLYGRPLETLLATYGLSLILIQLVRTFFGAQNVAVENPPLLSGGVEIFEGVVIPYSRIAVVLFTIIVVSFVAYVLRGTSLGLRVRAVTQNRSMAACMGIPTKRVDMWTFALGSGVGGLGGVALAQLGNVGPELGQGYIVDSFLVVVLGGVGKLVGCVVAAFSLGILNKVLEPIAGAVLGKIVVLIAVVLVIQKRPQGLFAPRGRSADGT